MALPVEKIRSSGRLNRRRWQPVEVLQPSFTSRQYIAAAVASALIWFLVGSLPNGSVSLLIGVLFIGGAVMLSPLLLAQRQIVAGLTVLAYLAAVQPAIRTYIPALRYNILEYTIPLSVFFILTQRRKFVLSVPTFFYLLYLGMEVVGVINSQHLDIVRSVFFASFTLFLILLVADQLELPIEQMTHIWQGYLVGALSILVLLARILLSGAVITWTTESNTQFTAGMGPNQVSFILSVAVFFALVLGDQATGRGRWIYRLLAGLLAYFMVLTFSRGGLYIVTGAILLYYLFFQRPQRSTWPVLFVFGGLIYAVLTIASDTTQGAILERYSNLDTTNRIVLAQQGWQLFLDNPILGVGTANYQAAVATGDYFGAFSGAHNELTRAAAEHGVFGLVFWCLFAFASLVITLRGQSGRFRALRLALLFIAFISMFYNGLKLVIQPLLILMAFTLISQSTTPEEAVAKKSGSLSSRTLPRLSRLQATRKAAFLASAQESHPSTLKHDQR